jgi:hypothetical protein
MGKPKSGRKKSGLNMKIDDYKASIKFSIARNVVKKKYGR